MTKPSGPRAVRRVLGADRLAFYNLVALLLHGQFTMAELAEKTGLNINTVQRTCAGLHNAGAAYICNWKLDGRGSYSIRIYKIGEGVDIRPPTRTRQQNAERMRSARKGLPYKTHTKPTLFGI